MMNKGVAIKYGDVAPEAKENFYPEASESEFNTLSQLQKYNLEFPNYGNPCELYSVVLDGMAKAFPSLPQQANIGLVSEQISGEDGEFAEPIVLTLTSVGNYTSSGFTFTFDTQNGIYPTKINIHWYRDFEGDTTDLGNEDFEPADAMFFCQRKVEAYNRVVITFYSLNMPKNRLKLRAVDYGHGTFFYGGELRNVKLIQEVDPVSTSISINTADFSLDIDSNADYSFQAKQPLSIYFNGELKATTFVKSLKRKSRFLWHIQSEDYIGLMDSIPYHGGIYTNAKVVDIFSDIFDTAKVPYSIDEKFENDLVTGYIPYTTCREALMQVAFAIQAVVDTSDSEVVKVFSLDEDIKQRVSLNRIMQGQNFVDEETVTGVEVAVHSYKPVADVLEIYDAAESGFGENIFIKFSEPLHDLIIENGEIVSSGTNYAIINATESSILKGKKYEHTTQTKRKNNPKVLASEIEKIISIDNATLVSPSNIDNVLDKCYNWLTITNTTNLRIVEGKHDQKSGFIKYGQVKYGQSKYGAKQSGSIYYDKRVNVGEIIEAETEYLGVVKGRIVKQSFNLNGGIIIKEAVIK